MCQAGVCVLQAAWLPPLPDSDQGQPGDLLRLLPVKRPGRQLATDVQAWTYEQHATTKWLNKSTT